MKIELLDTKHVQILRLGSWHWPSFGDAGYYGRRYVLTIGPLIIFIWQMTDKQYQAWADKWLRPAK